MKFIVVNKNTLIAYLLIISIVGCLLYFNLGTTSSVLTIFSQKRDLPIYFVDKDEKIISISFDAAWGNEDTQDLIDILDKFKVKTTFFLVGQWVDKYPESVKALHEAGHEIMNHSNTHPHMPQLSTDKMREEIKNCDDKIQAITGKKPFLFRPPFGDYNNTTVQVCREMGHYTIQWDVDSLDWKDLGVDSIYERVTKKVTNGSIVLFHNAAKYTPDALPRILENLIERGYKIVPISELIYRDDFYVDHQGKQILNTKETGSID